MKANPLITTCTGLTALALCACGPEKDTQGGQEGTPPSGSSGNAPAAAPAGSALSAGQKSKHFDAVSAHLDLGGEAYGYLDIDGDAEKLAEVVQSLIDLAKEAGGGDVPPPIANLKIGALLDELGLAGIEAMGMSSYKNGDLYHNKFYLHTPAGRTGLMKIFGGEAGPFVTQKLAPAGSDLVVEQRLDLKSAFELFRDLVGEIGGAEMAGEFERATNEPMPGGPPISISEVFANLDTRISVVARVHPDKPMPLPAEVPVKVPGIDALVALDNVGALVTKLVASIPEEERSQMLEEGDGYQQMAIPLPPDLAQAMQPVLRHDIASGRLLLATSPAFLDECLSGGSSVWDDAGFKAAMEGLPQEGNALGFVSSEFMKEYLRVYGEAMDTVSQGGGAPIGLGETVTGLLQTMGMTPDRGQATVMTNLPEGMLLVQNSAASAKQAMMMAGASVIGVGASTFMLASKQVTDASFEAEEAFREANRAQEAQRRALEEQLNLLPADDEPPPVPTLEVDLLPADDGQPSTGVPDTLPE